jgi:LPS export ABC transporter protein LptC
MRARLCDHGTEQEVLAESFIRIPFWGFFWMSSLAWTAVSCMKHEKSAPIPPEVGVEIARDVELIFSDSGRIQVVLQAPLVVRRQGSDPVVEMTRGIKATFYDQRGRVNSYLTAREAYRYPRKRVMRVRGNVVVTNTGGDSLFTERLQWEEQKGRISSDAYVRIVRPDEVLYGDGLESDDRFENYRILNTRGSFKVQH